MSTQDLRHPFRVNGLESGLALWARLAVHTVLKFMLPPGLSPEAALTWSRHVLDMARTLPQIPAVRARASAFA